MPTSTATSSARLRQHRAIAECHSSWLTYNGGKETGWVFFLFVALRGFDAGRRRVHDQPLDSGELVRALERHLGRPHHGRHA